MSAAAARRRRKARRQRAGAAPNPVYITDLVLRDAHQSLLATRMRTEDMLPIAAKINQAGYWSIEMWGGATFDSMMRFLNEDPWERVRALKATMPDTRLQMLLRGQNAVGYRNYADDVVRGVRPAGGAGRHRRVPGVRRPQRPAQPGDGHRGGQGERQVGGGHHQLHQEPGPLRSRPSWTTRRASRSWAPRASPSRTWPVCSIPRTRTSWSRALKHAHPDILVHMHCHYTSGMASMAYLKAVEAGADILDCAISSMSMGTSHPPTESMVAALAGTDRATGMDIGRAGGDLRVLPRYPQEVPGVRERLHRGRPGRAHVADPGRDDLQPVHPAQGTGRPRPHARGAWRRCRGSARNWAIRRW